MGVSAKFFSSTVSRTWTVPENSHGHHHLSLQYIIRASPFEFCEADLLVWPRRRLGKHSSSLRVGVFLCTAGEPFGASRGPRTDPSSPSSLHALSTQQSPSPIARLSSNVPKILVPGDVANGGARLNPPETSQKSHNEEVKRMNDRIEEVRKMFRSMTDGEISVSPYDTAWVALVPALDGSGGPQFPKSLQWIIKNQFSDGSWGDLDFFSFYDRICNTLSCLVALKKWDTSADAVELGSKFIRENLEKMETEEKSHMPIGFEIVFPTLMTHAEKLGLDLPYDAPIIEVINIEKDKKMKKIPMEIVHKVPTTLLHSLEGFHEVVEWEKLLKLQNEDGSFLNSPSATAAALLHIKDNKALAYLTRLVNRFDNAVPNVYPVDLFERMWMVDRLQRLGIDRYFEIEIKESLDYVFKYFTTDGIAWARSASVQDLDDTAMGFRLLRQHGYDVKENVFEQFRSKNGEFFCFAGQSSQAVTGLFNFYRASQIRFPREPLLEEAEIFTRKFLEKKYAKKECFDKWIITKDLPGEIGYALDLPWFCSLPRIENQVYLSHYGVDDIWIGKSFYRMPFINNEAFLDLAKADFNLLQSFHKEELHQLIRWNQECAFPELVFAREKVHECFFASVSAMPAPELSGARVVWTVCSVLATVIDDYFDLGCAMEDGYKFLAATKKWDASLMEGTAEEAKLAFSGFYNSVNIMAQDGYLAQGRDIGQHLRNTWCKWVGCILKEAEWTASGDWPSFEEYFEVAKPSLALEAIVLCTIFFLGETISDELVNDPKRLHLIDLVSTVGRLLNDITGYKRENAQGKPNLVTILMRENSGWTEGDAIAKCRVMIEESMLELSREVHRPSHIPKSIRQLHFNSARIVQLFYQKTDGFSSLTDMKGYVKKILFEPFS